MDEKDKDEFLEFFKNNISHPKFRDILETFLNTPCIPLQTFIEAIEPLTILYTATKTEPQINIVSHQLTMLMLASYYKSKYEAAIKINDFLEKI